MDKKYIDVKEFAEKFNIWKSKGKPKGNDPLYVYIWQTTMEAVKANISAIQKRYDVKYSSYEDRVMDATILVITKLLKMNSTPKSIISLSYLYTLGVCCGKKAKQQDWERKAVSWEEINGKKRTT